MRINTLKQHLNALPLLIESPLHLFYLTGMDLSAGQLIVTEEESALFVDGRYFETCQNKASMPVYLQSERPLLDWLKEKKIPSIGFEMELTTYQRYEALQASIQAIPVESPVLQMRLIKDVAEIQLLREAARLNAEGFRYVSSLLKVGVKEEELAVELEVFWRKKSAKKPSFDPIIAFGANGSMPHYRAGLTALQPNTSVLVDIGVMLNHYHSDMTRVVCVGSPDPKIKEIYSIVEEAKNRAIELCKPGTLIADLDKAARDYITEKGYGNYFTHSLGHGVGLEIHEGPTLRQKGPNSQIPLQAGMVITIEPGIYLPGIGGVRLEDTLVITSSGHENLYKN